MKATLVILAMLAGCGGGQETDDELRGRVAAVCSASATRMQCRLYALDDTERPASMGVCRIEEGDSLMNDDAGTLVCRVTEDADRKPAREVACKLDASNLQGEQTNETTCRIYPAVKGDEEQA